MNGVPPVQVAPAGRAAGRNLPAAVGMGVGLNAAIIASLFVVKVLFLAVVAVAVSVGCWELTRRLADHKGIAISLPTLLLGGVGMLAAGYRYGLPGAATALTFTVPALVLQRMRRPPEGCLRDLTAGVFTAFYLPFLASFVALMLSAHDGGRRVFLFLWVTFANDIWAYAAGRAFGRTKLAPAISPGKTYEGLAGGVVMSMLTGAVLMEWLIADGHWWQGLVLGGCTALAGTFGDLAESMVKRDLGIKDMGTLLPGHGGVMDRLDSLLPAAPVGWLLLVVFVGG